MASSSGVVRTCSVYGTKAMPSRPTTSTPTAWRFRPIFALSRPISPAEHAALWPVVAEYLEKARALDPMEFAGVLHATRTEFDTIEPVEPPPAEGGTDAG